MAKKTKPKKAAPKKSKKSSPESPPEQGTDIRKDLYGILLFFLVAFSFISLASYHSADPSIHNAAAGEQIHNLFGVIGAHVAGVLIGLFGLGAFWVPVLFLFTGIHFFKKRPRRMILKTAAGGVILAVTTGALFAVRQDDYHFFGGAVSSGGMTGIPFKAFIVEYCGGVGGTIVLILLWMIGFIMTTGVSMLTLSTYFWKFTRRAPDQIKSLSHNIIEKKEDIKNGILALKESGAGAPEPPARIEKAPPAIEHKPSVQKTPEKEVDPKPASPPARTTPLQGYAIQMPSLDFLDNPGVRPPGADKSYLDDKADLLVRKLEDFGVKGRVVNHYPGPVITTFEYEPAPGVKINKVVSLTDDLSLALKAMSIRIVAPIPGKSVIGIEIPNEERETVRLKDIIGSEAFRRSKSRLTICLGKDIVGNPVVAELERMPHLLIAGATGTGKSVGLNAMICSFLYKAAPDQVKLIMIDPKRIELSMYNGVPHLITPVVTDVKQATNALFWAVREMERRYELLSEKMVRNISQYNRKLAREAREENADPGEKLPYIAIIIDELADLMMVASRDVEVALTRLAQMARAAGIHLILATQRPSVDVLTGIIKVNFPTRLSFQVSSRTDSRTIIDANGAESLLGNGDMLFLPPGTAKVQRIHGAFISEDEITRIIDFLKQQDSPDYNQEVVEGPANEKAGAGDEDYDEKYDDALALVTKTKQASISMIQRHLRIGYNRAARIIEMMEREGVVGPSDGVKPREVLVRGYEDAP